MLDQKIDPVITPKLLEEAYTYQSYRQLIDDLLAQNKNTGTNHSEAYLEYSRLNVHRMGRLDRTVEINEDLAQAVQQIQSDIVWLVITEGWCGDAAQNLPVIQKIAALSPKISLKLILRDENLEVMDQYLTNGGRSIPKLIALNADTLETMGTWGPRPVAVQQMMLENKANPNGISSQDLSIEIQKWYAKDRTQTVQAELLDLMKSWL